MRETYVRRSLSLDLEAEYDEPASGPKDEETSSNKKDPFQEFAEQNGWDGQREDQPEITTRPVTKKDMSNNKKTDLVKSRKKLPYRR